MVEERGGEEREDENKIKQERRENDGEKEVVKNGSKNKITKQITDRPSPPFLLLLCTYQHCSESRRST